MKWPTNQEQHEHMREMVKINKKACKKNDAENWMYRKLVQTGLKWTRQAQWGYRIFDFWNAELGIAVEVDGLSHNKKYDSIRDSYNYKKSGILVLRVKNFDEKGASRIIKGLMIYRRPWNHRRESLGLKEVKMIPSKK